jgi:predicted amidohydrolase YtcJ
VDEQEQPWLYRARSFLTAGVPLAGGSDAPFGGADPWQIMRTAVARCTRAGTCMRVEESLSPEQALDLFLTPPAAPGTRPVSIEVGGRADLCLLHQPWTVARNNLRAELVRFTWRDGHLIHGTSHQTENARQ